ncbi:MAG: uroporphyrinogen-III synthase, partial [Gemmatimonadota bacterium]|nr:uroporphyrinogen-III synthase [Gemmatimonadota bacterium]
EVIEVPVYSTQMEAPENLGQVRADLEQGKIDVLTFTSSSTVDNFIKMVGEPAVSNLSRDVLVASIGPVTAQSAKKHGLETRIMPEDYTVEALAAAIRDHFRGTLYG